MDNPKDNELSIVLPVFNEEDVIERTIREIEAYTLRFIGKAEIIAVNDGSTDGTAKVLDRLSRTLPNLKVVTHEQNRGYGGALYSGIKAVSSHWMLLMDPDGQFHIDSLNEIWPHRHDHEVLLGYRQKRGDNLYRVALGRLSNTILNSFLSRHINDLDCGFKIFKSDLIREVPLSSRGGAINFEIIHYLLRKFPSIKIYQYPVRHYPRETGKAKGGTPKKILRMAFEGLRIVFRTRG
ncbi:MAG: glycosyltransferase family 2 protein [Candidatus Omnitrophica bacterium]|nr:glycosyltransferase family 2 protein [Candidatus Omnitrophota bacterium]MDE2221726.1 glycosyltransferase family 2 protein [Candidatus Omnitrophota bacterium]